MAILKILQYPDPRLKTVAKPVDDVHDTRIQRIIDDMLETLVNTPRCGGLAATQLDIADPPRIFVFYDADDSASSPTCVINPRIVATEGEVLEEEGCMSVYPEQIQATLSRPVRTRLKALDRDGREITLEREGYRAKLFVHECDHLAGRLYIDRLKPLKRKLLDRKIDKMRRRQDDAGVASVKR